MKSPNSLIQDLLASMDSAACNIQQDAMHKGFKGNENDAEAVLSFLRDYAMDAENYALLYANSAVIEDCYRNIMNYGNEADKVIAAKWGSVLIWKRLRELRSPIGTPILLQGCTQ